MSTPVAIAVDDEPGPVRHGLRKIVPYPAHNPRARELTILVAIAAIALLGLDRNLPMNLTTGTVVVFALLPVWISTLREFQFAPVFMLLGGVTLAWGAVLHQFDDERSFSMRLALEIAILFFTGIGGVGVLLWARTILPTYIVVMIFGGAYLLGVAQAVPGSANAWKYLVSVPLTMILLAWASKAHTIAPTIMTLGFIGLVSVAFDSRSYFGFCLLSIVLVLWQRRKNASGRKMSKLATLSLIAIALTALYYIGSALLVEGYLGEEAQERTVEQIQESGSLLVSGRPEWAGTIELMLENPMGFGLGTLPSSDDVWAAKEGMVKLGLSPDNGYVQNYMFGGHVKLHSIVADFWASFGIFGFIFALTIIGIIVYCLLEHLSNRTASGLICMMSIIAVWDMAFGPIFTNLPDVMLALAVVLPAWRTMDRSPTTSPPSLDREVSSNAEPA